MPFSLPPAESKLSMRTLACGYLPSCNDFDLKLVSYIGIGRCVLAGSARALLYLLLMHLKTCAGKNKTEVLIPGYTCYSVPAAAVKAGLRVRLYDMDPHSFQPDMDDVAKKIKTGTLAVIGQHLLGVRADMAALIKTAHKGGAYCIEDSAQILEAPEKGLQNQQQADFTVYSFGRGKPLPLGCGGALVAAKSEELGWIADAPVKAPVRIGNYFLPAALQVFSNPFMYWFLEKLPLGLGKTLYDPTFPVSAMPRIYRQMGAHALEELDRLNRHRTIVSGIYNDHFTEGKISFSMKRSSVPVRYPLLVEKQGLAQQLFHYGVRRLYPLALCDLAPLQESLADGSAQTPGARQIAGHLITLPTHLSINEKTAVSIAGEVKKTFSI